MEVYRAVVFVLLFVFSTLSAGDALAYETPKNELNVASASMGDTYYAVLVNLMSGYWTDVFQSPGCSPVPVFIARLAHACGVNSDGFKNFYCEFLSFASPSVQASSPFCESKRKRRTLHQNTCTSLVSREMILFH